MLGQYTFGLKAIDKNGLTSGALYFGDAVGGKSTAGDAGALDFKAGKQFYYNKARLNLTCFEDVLPLDNGGTKGVVTVTPTVTTAGAGSATVMVEGEEYTVAIAATDSTATKVGDAIRAALNSDRDFKLSNWTVGGTSTIVFTQKVADGYTYDANDWDFDFDADSTGVVSFSPASSTSSVAPTAYGTTFTLQHADTKTGTYTDLVSFKLMHSAMVAQNSPIMEFTVPSTAKQFMRMKVQSDANTTSGIVLVAVEPKN